MPSFRELFKPKVERIGPFRLLVFNDILADEAEAFEQWERKQAENLFSTLSLAKRIAEEQSRPIDEVLNDLQSGGGENADQLAGHAAEIAVIMRESVSATAIQKNMVAAMLRSRGSFIDESGAEYELEDFTEDDAGQIPRKTLGELYAFLLRERNGGKSQAVEDKPPQKTKRGGARKSSVENQPIGSHSTGESQPVELQTQDSTSETSTDSLLAPF